MTYIIGEIGQNHNGSINNAKLLIDIASRPIIDKLFGQKLQPMDAVKFTKRDLNNELTTSMMNKPYDSPNSFGITYGEHRKFLELNDEEHHELYEYTKKKNLEFVETICATGCFTIFNKFYPDKLKVASRDLTNLPLLSALSETNIPIILSTGMGGKKEIDDALNIITKHHENISILHCVSEYPTQYKHVNLKTISWLKKNYSNYITGYSDHTIGIATPIAAVSLGAKIIEKHITLDRNMKGTDHSGSLGPDGIFRMVRDIRNLELSMGSEDIGINKSVYQAKNKLERSIATNKKLNAGAILTINDIHLLSPGDGYKWSEMDSIIGRQLKRALPANEIIYEKDLIKNKK